MSRLVWTRRGTPFLGLPVKGHLPLNRAYNLTFSFIIIITIIIIIITIIIIISIRLLKAG